MDEQSGTYIANALGNLMKANQIEVATGDKFGINEVIKPCIKTLTDLLEKIMAGEI